jgi:hypothetical protein
LAGGYYLARLMRFPFDPSPSTLWTLQRDGKVASCEVRFVPIGNEVRMLRNGSLLVSQIFESGDEALTWADEERERMLGEGWAPRTRTRREGPNRHHHRL